MKKNIFLIAAILLIILITGRTMAQERPPLDKETSERLIRSIQQLVNDSNYQKLGFPSPADAKNVSIGKEIRVSVIPLDKLKELNENTGTLQSIKTPSASSFYQLIGGRSQRPIALANIETKEGKTMIRGFGSTNLATSITEVSERLSPELQKSAELVRILALQLDFLAVTEQGTTYYMSLTTIPDLQMEKGSRLTEQAVLSKVLPLARRYNGLPW